MVDDDPSFEQLVERLSLRRAFAIFITRDLLPSRMPGVQIPVLTTLEEVQELIHENTPNWTQEWKDQGREEALQVVRPAVLIQLEQRFGHLTEETRRQVEAMTSAETLAEVITRVLSASSLAELGLDS